MVINLIQFQKGLSLSEFMRHYGTEAQCEAVLFQARWAKGFRCPECWCEYSAEFRRSCLAYWQCHICRQQSSLNSGTLMHHTWLTLTKWFLTIYQVNQSKRQIAELGLRRQVGVS